jgi:hypothetical protein
LAGKADGAHRAHVRHLHLKESRLLPLARP